jgi:phosphatidylglycerol---prolipoprotein diacylglyceryl transferase
MEIPLREGIALNISFLYLTDILAILLMLALSFFNLLPNFKIKNEWIRSAIYIGITVILAVILRMLFKTTPLTTLNIRWYGVLIMLGALAAAWLATREAKRRGLNPDYVWDMLPWLLAAGVIGSRLWHIFLPPSSMIERGITTQYYLTHPMEAIAIWNGGVGIPGAILGGALALFIYSKVKHTDFAMWTDIAAPGIALAQAIGRWGNFLNQEIYGAPTTLPWGIHIDPVYRLTEYADQATYHPLFLYESIWNLLNMAVLLFLGRRYGKKLFTGDIFIIYILIYSFGRFLLEYLRLDPAPVAGINANQTFMAILFCFSVLYLLWKHIIQKKKA